MSLRNSRCRPLRFARSYMAPMIRGLPLACSTSPICTLPTAIDEAEPVVQRVLTIRERTLGPEAVGVADALVTLAYVSRLQHRFGNAEELYERPVAIYRKVLGPRHPAVAVALDHLAQLYIAEGRAKDADDLYDEAQKLLEAAIGDAPGMAGLLNN